MCRNPLPRSNRLTSSRRRFSWRVFDPAEPATRQWYGIKRTSILACDLEAQLALLITFLIGATTTLPSIGAARERVALVIGNAAYAHAPVLANSKQDAALISRSLARLGFKVVNVADAGFDMLRRALLDFSEQAVGADFAVVFYSGHGLHLAGETWLVPVDAELRFETDLRHEAVALQSLISSAGRAARLGLVILDACRANAFLQRLRPTGRGPSTAGGPADPDTRAGVLVAHACREGAVAVHEHGRSSPFTAALLAHIETSGLEIGRLFRNVRDDVQVATNREQEPFTYGSLSRETIYLRPPGMPLLVDRHLPTPTLPVDRPPTPLSRFDEHALKPGDSFTECPRCPRMMVIPKGSFMMGSPPDEAARFQDEGPQSKVTIPAPLAVAVHEVTRGEYEAFLRASGHRVTPGCRIWDHTEILWDNRPSYTYRTVGFEHADDHPVVCVDWTDAKAFAAWLRKETGKSYRLLTEAEWEYAARAGTTTAFAWGATASTDLANYDGTSTYGPKGRKAPWRRKTTPVGSFKANPWGLFDMHGNVWEWVEDCYGREDYRHLPPVVRQAAGVWPGSCEPHERAFRGGSWLDDAEFLRAARRVEIRPGGRYSYLGIRVARTIDQ